jgi:hypothetical protein
MSLLFNPGTLWLATFTSIATWALLLKINWPWLEAGGYKRIFTVLAGVHLFRHVGLVALSPTHVDPALGLSFAYLAQVGYGDWMANVLAIVAILAVRGDWKSATFWSWAFIIVGTADTLNAGPNFILAITDQNNVGAMGWLILTWYVPVIAITEGLIIWQLVKRARQPKTAMTLHPMNAAPSM